MTTFYVASNGSSANDGSIGSPWTLAFACSGASGAIHAGDTILLRGGAYNLVAGFTLSVSGTAGLPIEFKAYPGETPIIDGCYQEFITSPTTAWEPYDLVGHNVYRSTGTYTSGGTHDGCGFMTMDGKLRTLLPHPNGLTYITSDVQDFVYPTPSPRYMGYGFAWNPASSGGDNKIYIRLDTPDAGSMLAADAANGHGFHNGYPVLADPDPRNYQISMFPVDQIGIRITGNYITFGLGILVKNYMQGFSVTGAGVTMKGGEYQYGYQGMRGGNGGGLTMAGVYFNAAMPSQTSWWAWTDVKGGETPAQRARKNAILLDTASNVEIKNCIVRECFDGILTTGGNIHDIYVHDNLFDNVWDDAWQLSASPYRVEFARNNCFGAGISHDSGGSDQPNGSPGTVYIHHNVFDTTKYLVFWGRRGRNNVGQGNNGDEGLRTANCLPTHGVATSYSQPWKFYYNTIVMDRWGKNTYIDISEFSPSATNHQAVHEVYNNIFVTQKQIGNHFFSASGHEIYDGNVYYYPIFLSLHWRFITTSTGLLPVSGEPTGLMDTVAEMHATQAFPDSKVYYAPGWEASGMDLNPQLDANYVPQATAVQAGAVNITSKGWPGASVYQAYRGAMVPSVLSPTTQLLAFQVTNFAFQGIGLFVFEGTPGFVPPPNPDTGGDQWWGTFDTQMFPYIPPPPLGYTPPPPVPNPAPPRYTLMVLDNGFIGYVLTGS